MGLKQEAILARDLDRVKAKLHAEQSAVEPYAEQYRTLLDNHGKMLRASLVLIFARTQAGSSASLHESIITGAASIEMLHLATLVHDDVVDGADVRRNKPTVHTIVGNKAAIYLGDLILSRYVEIMTTIAPDIAFMGEQAAVLRTIISGELLQESARHNTHASIEHYMQAISGKTAALFQHACVTGLRLSCNQPSDIWIQTAREFGKHIGIAFQIADDIDDFDLAQNSGKPKLEDIADGIYTLPVLLAMQSNPELVINLDANDTDTVINFLNTHSAPLATSIAIAKQHITDAEALLDTLPLETGIHALLQTMLDEFASHI